MTTLPFYTAHYQQLQDPLLAMMLSGVRIDKPRAAELRHTLTTDCKALRSKLDDLTHANQCRCHHPQSSHRALSINIYDGHLKKDGKPRKAKFKTVLRCIQCDRGHKSQCSGFAPVQTPLHTGTDLSSTRIINYLYSPTGLGFPRHRKRGGKNPSADEVIVRKLLLKTHALEKPKPRSEKYWQREPARTIETLTGILEHREKAKLATYLEPSKLDNDGRLRCMYKVTTETGRLASARNPKGTGFNLQNVPRPVADKPYTLLRQCFLPDPGHVLIEFDYSQIEDRIVKVKSGDREAIRLARLHPSVYDAHTESAKSGFSLLRSANVTSVTKDERQIFKPFRHGANYDAHAPKVQDTLLKEGHILSLEECVTLLGIARAPYVLAYQQEIRRRIMRDRRLTNSWGRVLDFTGCRLNDETYRRGYAWWAASENADNLNQLGLIPLHNYLRSRNMASRIMLQVHDSLVVSCPVDEIYQVARFLVRSMETTRAYDGVRKGVKLSVPVELKMGENWMGRFEWKKLPEREEMEKCAMECLEAAEARDEEIRKAA